ncbi:chalcone isomerase family protein [Nonlabens ponticola]|uniref:Chalcone isomerase n=1 Tax=Nonlabens ponticola TaxID=2496866 RepID=A0A3S9MYX5_9FLAO|nr:chalcone isomerase family protein [Nonlabens ponticola]AZQ44466.1 chalcone isomerase [Nonlabens ponticola]
MKKLLLVAVAFMGIYTADAQIVVEDVTVEKSVTVDGKELMLNGAGLREKLWIDLYVGGLYTTTKSSDGKAIVNADEFMAITLDIVSKLVTQDKMISSVEEGFQASTSKAERKALQPKIDKFIGFFNKPIVSGNEFQLSYVPGKGTMVHKNGALLGTIEGMDFKKALFGIWLGDKPADDDLKDGLLGK